MALMVVQRKGVSGAVFQNVDFEPSAPRAHVLFANALVCSMCDEFDVYWEPEVSQGYRNFHGLAKYARISNYVLRAIKISFLEHDKFVFDLEIHGSKREHLLNFIDSRIQRLLLSGGKSLRDVVTVLACVVGVCVSLYRSGCKYAPSLCAVKIGKMIHTLDEYWNGELYSSLDDYARCQVERRNLTRSLSDGSCDSNDDFYAIMD